jgi:acetyl esterase
MVKVRPVLTEISARITNPLKALSTESEMQTRISSFIALLFALTLPGEIQAGATDKVQGVVNEAMKLAQKPDSWFLQEVGGKRIRVDDQVLDIRIQHLMKPDPNATTEEGSGPDMTTPEGLNTLRDMFDEQWVAQTVVPPQMAWVRDISIPARDGTIIPARAYRPAGTSQDLPVLVYYHGGGWVFGSIDAIDRASKWMAAEANMLVISVDYRLAPEAPYPAAWNDAEDAFGWATGNAGQFGGDTSRICVGGDSAGGNLSVAVSTRRIAKGLPSPTCQLLYYPGVDNRDIPTMRANYLSSRLFGVGFWLDYTFTEFVLPLTFPDQDLAAPEISPLFAPMSEMAKLPPTILVAAGFDPLRDSNRAYAEKLKNAGVPVNYREIPSLIHGIINLTAVTPVAHRAAVDVARDLGNLARQ